LAPSGKPSLAVIYFDNNTGDENMDHWRKALAELLVADLSQSRYIHVLSGDRIFNILGELNLLEVRSYSSEDLKKVAAKGGVDNVLRESYTKAGNTIRINTMLHKAENGELIGSHSAEGQGEQSIFTMVDDLTRQIKENLRLTAEEISSDSDMEAARITTSYPEAFRYYTEGRKYALRGDYRQGVSILKKALEIDPEFAMAHRSISAGYGNLGDIERSLEHFEKAFEVSDR
jgi:TolB-like protein